MHFLKIYVITYEEGNFLIMTETDSLQPLTKAITDHLRDQGKPVPPDEELINQAKSLLSFFEILIKADRGN